jgi:hypothetical protein
MSAPFQSFLFMHWLIFYRSAVTSGLCKYEADGTPRNLPTVIEFKISPASKSTNTMTAQAADPVVQEGPAVEHAANAATQGEYDVVVAEMKEAVPQGKQAFEQIKSAPLLLEGAQDAIEASTAMVDHVESVAKTWSSLLETFKLFTDLVDKIAEVRNLNIRQPLIVFDNKTYSLGASVRKDGVEHPFCHSQSASFSRSGFRNIFHFLSLEYT